MPGLRLNRPVDTIDFNDPRSQAPLAAPAARPGGLGPAWSAARGAESGRSSSPNGKPASSETGFVVFGINDEHFYPVYFRKYHWPMHAFALPDEVLKKVYRHNALALGIGAGTGLAR